MHLQESDYSKREVDWADLPPELLALCIRSLGRAAHSEAEQGWLTPRQAAQLLASCSACHSWRAAALSELRCFVKADTAEDVGRLAAAAPPCTAVCLPAAPPLDDCASLAAWAAQRRCQAAALRLLLGRAFRASSASCLSELRNCPLDAAQSGVLTGYTALRQLGLSQGLCIGQPAALRGSSLPGTPAGMAQLELALPAGGTLDALRWPPCLQRCVVVVPSSSCTGGADGAGGHCAAPAVCVRPCRCAWCLPAGFWSSLGSLHVEAPRVMLHLDACHALHSCRSLRIVAVSDSQSAQAAAAQAQAAAEGAAWVASLAVQPWLAALASLFAATDLRRVDIVAGSACLEGGQDSDRAEVLGVAAPGVLLSEASARLSAAALPPGSCQSGNRRGLFAKLCRSSSSAHFGLAVTRLTEKRMP